MSVRGATDPADIMAASGPPGRAAHTERAAYPGMYGFPPGIEGRADGDAQEAVRVQLDSSISPGFQICRNPGPVRSGTTRRIPMRGHILTDLRRLLAADISGGSQRAPGCGD